MSAEYSNANGKACDPHKNFFGLTWHLKHAPEATGPFLAVDTILKAYP